MATQCTTHKMTTFQRHAGRLFAGLLLCCASAGLGAQELAVTDPAAAPLGDLVRKFTDAQVQRDAAALRALTSEQYIEVSPVGELDPREKMLGFYVKDASRAAPARTVPSHGLGVAACGHRPGWTGSYTAARRGRRR